MKLPIAKIWRTLSGKKWLAYSLILLVVVIVAGVVIICQEVSNKRFAAARSADLQTAANDMIQGKTDEAIKILEARYAKDKSDSLVARQLALDYFQAKDYSKFQQITDETNISDAQIYTRKAFIARSAGDQAAAIADYQKAIALSPQSSTNYIDLANYYQVLGQIDKAFSIVKEGLNFSPNSSTLNLFAANYSLDLGNKTAAKSYAALVLKIDSKNPRAKEILSLK